MTNEALYFELNERDRPIKTKPPKNTLLSEWTLDKHGYPTEERGLTLNGKRIEPGDTLIINDVLWLVFGLDWFHMHSIDALNTQSNSVDQLFAGNYAKLARPRRKEFDNILVLTHEGQSCVIHTQARTVLAYADNETRARKIGRAMSKRHYAGEKILDSGIYPKMIGGLAIEKDNGVWTVSDRTGVICFCDDLSSAVFVAESLTYREDRSTQREQIRKARYGDRDDTPQWMKETLRGVTR